MPKRHDTHVGETESRRAFVDVLPPRVLFREEEQPEYGIDGEVEYFDEAGEATGKRFRVQLKSSNAGRLRSVLKARIKNSTAEYLRAHSDPVLMVMFARQSRRLFARWFHEFDPHYEHVGGKHLTFHWSESNELTATNVEELLSQAVSLIKLRADGISLPVATEVLFDSPALHHRSSAEIALAVEQRIRQAPGVIELAEADSALQLHVREDALVASLSGMHSISFDLGADVYEARETDEIAADLMICAAAVLGRAGRGEAAARLAVQSFGRSMAALGLARPLLDVMLDAGRYGEILQISRTLDEGDEEVRLACSYLFLKSVLGNEDRLQPHEARELEAALRDRYEQRLAAGAKAQAAASAENLGRHLMAMKRPGEAFRVLKTVLDLDPSRLSEDLLQRTAGAAFLSHQYPEAVVAYADVLDYVDGPHPHLLARQADALLFSGRYAEAKAVFESVVDHQVEDDLFAWVVGKLRALDWIIESTGIDEQHPDHEGAAEIAGQFEGASDEEMERLAKATWNLDAASPLGWFNYARTLLDRGDLKGAMHSYLVAAVMREGDVEAWVNVTLLAMQTLDADLMAASAITARRLNPGDYESAFARQVGTQISDLESRDTALRTFRDLLDDSRSQFVKNRDP